MTTANADTESKAHGFNTTVAALRKMVDAAQFQATVAALPADTAHLTQYPPASMAWLPLRHFAALVDAAHAVGFVADLARVSELGRQAIGADLGSVYRVFIKIASPDFVIQRAAKLWSVYNRNNGALTTARKTANSVDLVYTGLHHMSAALWAYQRGAILAVVDATRLSAPSVDFVDGNDRDSGASVLRVSWS